MSAITTACYYSQYSAHIYHNILSPINVLTHENGQSWQAGQAYRTGYYIQLSEAESFYMWGQES